MIRFYTTGTQTKLILVQHNPIFETGDLDQLLESEKAQEYVLKTKKISSILDAIFK